MSHSLTVTELTRRFADYVNRVAYRGETFVLVRGKKPIAELRPLPAGRRLSELPGLVAGLPRLAPRDVEAFASDVDDARRTAADPGVRDSMAVLIDASILIEAERGRLDLSAHMSGSGDDDFHLSVVTASELLHGVHRATTAKVRATRSAYVEAVLDRFPLLDVDLGTARAHARLAADLAAKGKLIGSHDLWLAATCLAHGMRIVTANVREFRRVPGLVVEEWKSRR